MQQVDSFETAGGPPSDLNGNDFKNGGNTKKRLNGGVKDHIVTTEGRVFYPCQFCNKVFPIKKSRTFHLKQCSAKEYILSVDEDSPNDNTQPEGNIPKTSKIDIQQNIVLNEQMDVSEILSKSTSPPIKLTIRRTINNDSERTENFTVTNSIVLKEKNKSNDDILTITQRLESNAVTLLKQPKKETHNNEDSDDSTETACRVCTKEFESPLELLRHSRKCHSYPKVQMALSEVKKFYSVKDRSECPICHKPLKTNFRSAFVKHLHTHTNEMKYSCQVCNKKFRRSDHMKAHEKRHIIKDRK